MKMTYLIFMKDVQFHAWDLSSVLMNVPHFLRVVILRQGFKLSDEMNGNEFFKVSI